MKKILILFSFLILFTGCSKDDDSPKEEQEIEIPVNEKILNDIGGEILLEYNDAGNIERLKISSELLLIYGYEGEKISSLDIYGGDGSINILFQYDANGRIDSFSEDDVITDVTYNEANNYYLYQKENGDETTLFINVYGDIYKIVEYNIELDETETSTMLYEDEIYNGTLTNTNNPIIQTVMGFPELSFFYPLYNISKKPVRTITGSSFGILDLENTYDSQNFLETSTFGIEEPTTLIFNYTQL